MDAKGVSLSRWDKLWNSVCVLGLTIAVCAGILMIPLCVVFFGVASVNLVMEAAVSPLRSLGMAALRSEVAQVKIDPIKGSTNIAGMKVDYRVDHFKINSFSLNTSEVTFNLQLGKITIDSKQDQVEMSFRWKFETDLLHVGDSGTGVGSSDNVHMTLALKIASLSSVKVISCSLIVSDLELNFDTGGSESFLFDAAVKFFQDVIIDEVQTEVCKQLKGKKFSF